MKKIRLKLEVDVFAGTNVVDAASDLCQLADRIGVLCVVDFNGVKLWAYPGGNPQRLIEAFYEQIKLPEKCYRVAITS